MNEQCVVKSIYDVVKTINFLFMNLDEVTTTYHKFNRSFDSFNFTYKGFLIHFLVFMSKK
jgi:hypothetical protein